MLQSEQAGCSIKKEGSFRRGLSVVIPSYRRGEILLDTIRHLLTLSVLPCEILIVDQTEEYPPEINEIFQGLEKPAGKFPTFGKNSTGFSKDWKKSFQGLENIAFRRIILSEPSIPHAMNVGLQEAKGEIVLFLDDDIIPDADLIFNHWKIHEEFPDAWAVAGRVLQPGENAENRNTETLKTEMREKRERKTENGKSESLKTEKRKNAETLKAESLKIENLKTEKLKKRERNAGNGKSDHLKTGVSNFQRFKFSAFISSGFQNFRLSAFASSIFQHFRFSAFQASSSLRRDLDFKFNSSSPTWVTNVMAGNLSVKKESALRIGGFDENFIPPVSFRFETEFAKRLIAAGGKIRFEPAASIKHLRAGQGGTRTHGSHLSSASSLYGVGDYYYALRCGSGFEKTFYMLRRPFREVRTKFHLTHPWFIPVKWIGELRAFALACRLNARGPEFLRTDDES